MVTLQEALPGVVSGFGEQLSPVSVTGWLIVTVPPLAVTAKAFPNGSLDEGFLI